MNPTWTRFLPAFIRTRLEGRQTLQKIISNTGWLFADKALRMGVGLLVSVWVARYLGPGQFGLLNYVGAFVALFSTFATLGLDGIVVREIVRHPGEETEILGSAFVLKLIGGVLTLLAAVGSISLMRQGDPLTRSLVGIVAAGTLFQAFDVIDFWFQSQVLSKYTVIAKNGAFIVIALAKVVLILLQAPLIAFALAGLAEIALGAVGLVVTFRRNGHTVREWQGSTRRCRELLANSWPLILSGLSVAVYMKIDQVMLGEMVGNEAVGIYTSATKISEIWYFIPVAIVSSVFPSIIHARNDDEGLYYRRVQRLFSLMTALSLSIAVPMTVLSTTLVVILYGKGFLSAGPVLAVHIWASLFVFLGVAQGSWDLTENLTRLALFRIAAGALLNVVLNLFLIPAYSVMGAAVATVISQAFCAVILNAANAKTRRIFYCQIKSLLFVRYLRNI